MAGRHRKLNRLNDAYVKYIFAMRERKHITQSFVNAFLEEEGTPQLVDFEFRDREMNSERQKMKRSQLDLLGSCTDGTLANVEFQVIRLQWMPVRTLFYWAGLYRRLMQGEDYSRLRRTICIDVLGFDMFPEEVTPDWRNCFGILNKKHPTHALTDHMELHFVELPKWERNRPPKWENMSRLERWLAYFSARTSNEEMEAIAMSDPMIQAALKAEQAFLLDPIMLSAYDAAEEARRDRVARDNYVRDEGIKIGMEKGMEKGKEEMVIELLKMHQPIDFISRISKFTEEQILEIGKRYGV